MNVEHMCADIHRAPLHRLPELAQKMWAAFGADQLSEAAAEALQITISAREGILKAFPSEAAASRPAPRRVGSRPISSDSTARRRKWAASGRLPPNIAAYYSLGEHAVLAVIAAEIAEKGDCRLAAALIGSRAGVGLTTTRRAIREAERAGHISVQRRPRGGLRHDTSIIQLRAADWITWARLPRRSKTFHGDGRTGVGTETRTNTDSLVAGLTAALEGKEGASETASRPPKRPQ